jgi:L-alanine-DL-glutamate epimerase-like enolase superfamily enzyme
MAADSTPWDRLRGLPLVVESYEYERLSRTFAYGFERVTTLVRLAGGGAEGLGEDVSPFKDEAPTLHAVGPVLALAGEWTLESFCDHLAALDQWPIPPEWEPMRRWRNWAFESAALDLALNQAGRPLHEAIDREPRPLRFVNSLGLGDPPSVDRIARRVALNPTVGFKLDAEISWTPEIVGELASLDRVRTVDFKGRYGMEVPDTGTLVAMYRAVLDAFPDALLEDPHDLPEIDAVLEPVRDRVSFDAPITRVADITTRTINVKPTRIGGLRPLFEIYEHCAANGIAMYGGGMGELGIARGQVELLASMFHPDADNDVAPSEFNAPELEAALPSSPLLPPALSPGFRWG